MKKIVFCVFCLFFAVAGLWATSSLSVVAPGLSEEAVQTLLRGETIAESTVDGDIVYLAPVDGMIYDKTTAALEIDNGFSIAISSLIPYPEACKSLSAEEIQLKLYNIALSISTQKGIEYVSHRAGDKLKTLFDDSYMLGSHNKKDKIADPVVESLPKEEQYLAYQDDTTFGGNIYNLDYATAENEIFMKISNAETLGFMGLKLIAEGKLTMYLDICQVDEGIYLYGMASILNKKPKMHIGFYTVDLEESFFNRVIALRNWFSNEVSK